MSLEHLARVRATANSGKPILSPSGWPSHALIQTAWPDLAGYFSLVRGFNSRTLTYESDAVRAFSAIIDVFSRSFRGGFLFGIPEFVFDVGLLWSANKPLKRRKSFPSWSWVGWSGETDLVSHEIWQPEPWSDTKVHIWPAVVWEKRHGESSTYVRIDNSYHLYQSMADNDLEADLPPGRFRKEGVFSHYTIQDQKFLYPFPIAAGPSAPAIDVWSPLLKCQANRCVLFLGRPCDDTGLDESHECLVIELKDKNGAQVGVIESGFTDEKDYIQGEPCSILAISEGRAKRSKEDDDEWEDFPSMWQVFNEMDLIPELQNEDYYNFYNVLWIEREKGISYRKALGRVVKAAWERQNLQSARIILGWLVVIGAKTLLFLKAEGKRVQTV
jgi:hypothetical protein